MSKLSAERAETAGGSLDPVQVQVLDLEARHWCQKCGTTRYGSTCLCVVEPEASCRKCKTPRDSHGFCQCEREERYESERDDLDVWLESLTGDDREQAQFLVFSGLRRAGLRLGQHSPSHLPMVSRMQYDSLQARKASGIEPKWSRPKVSDPDELPV